MNGAGVAIVERVRSEDVMRLTGGRQLFSHDVDRRLLRCGSRNPSTVQRFAGQLWETPMMSSRRVTDEDGRIWECKAETEAAPGRDVNVVCTTASLPEPVRLKVSWQWATIAEKGLARMITATAPRLATGYKGVPVSVKAKPSRNVRTAKRGAI